MNRKRRRVTLLISAFAVLAVALGLVLTALQDTIVFFYSPSDLQEKNVPIGTSMRLGGLVEEGSVVNHEDNIIEFRVTDGVESILVQYKGIVPDLFRAGQGVVAQGTLEPDQKFTATSILAKHDENYMPREVSDALKKAGRWQQEKETP